VKVTDGTARSALHSLHHHSRSEKLRWPFDSYIKAFHTSTNLKMHLWRVKCGLSYWLSFHDVFWKYVWIKVQTTKSQYGVASRKRQATGTNRSAVWFETLASWYRSYFVGWSNASWLVRFLCTFPRGLSLKVRIESVYVSSKAFLTQTWIMSGDLPTPEGCIFCGRHTWLIQHLFLSFR
jgi:hypothetical protein